MLMMSLWISCICGLLSRGVGFLCLDTHCDVRVWTVVTLLRLMLGSGKSASVVVTLGRRWLLDISMCHGLLGCDIDMMIRLLVCGMQLSGMTVPFSGNRVRFVSPKSVMLKGTLTTATKNRTLSTIHFRVSY